ncbi:unannotated protein [freshwater metagenome]|uniref:Unannotated protein n=1 Tax=freshwater metagenome TaxID=449393 RepID=A0A6J7NQQ2_9ZZZZ
MVSPGVTPSPLARRRRRRRCVVPSALSSSPSSVVESSFVSVEASWPGFLRPRPPRRRRRLRELRDSASLSDSEGASASVVGTSTFLAAVLRAGFTVVSAA